MKISLLRMVLSPRFLFSYIVPAILISGLTTSCFQTKDTSLVFGQCPDPIPGTNINLRVCCYEYCILDNKPESIDRKTTNFRLIPKPVYLILWTGTKPGSYKSPDVSKQRISIHNHPIAVALNKKAVYALHADYTLKEILLSKQETDHVLQLTIDNSSNPSSIHFLKFFKDDIWRAKVLPHLQRVEEN